jgi:hypothetical protein
MNVKQTFGVAGASALVLALALSACTQGSRRVAESGPTVTYSYGDRSGREQADIRAEEYCSDYGLNARLRDTDERNGTTYAVYECV